MASELKAAHRKIQTLEKRRNFITARRNEAKIKINQASQGVLRAQLKREQAFMELTRCDTLQDKISLELRETNRELNGLLTKAKEKREISLKPDKDQRNFLLAAAGKKCEVCGATEDLEVHHIKPLSEGGSNGKDNLTVLCNRCHNRVHGNGSS